MKVFSKRPFTRISLHNQEMGQEEAWSGMLVQNSLLLSNYQRNPGGIYDTLSGF